MGKCILILNHKNDEITFSHIPDGCRGFPQEAKKMPALSGPKLTLLTREEEEADNCEEANLDFYVT